MQKTGRKFLVLTILHTFAFPKKTVDQCDKCIWGPKTAGGSFARKGRHYELQARVAQLVEQLICNQLVGGSSPFSGSGGGGTSPKDVRCVGVDAPDVDKNGQVAKWPTATDCKSVLFGVRWFESILAHIICRSSAKAMDCFRRIVINNKAV